jgi:hypothetical protein
VSLTLDLKPTAAKIAIATILIGGACLPVDDVDAAFITYQILWIPFSYFLRIAPFVASDKPWYIMQTGAVFAAVVWSALIYLLLSIKRVKR